MTNYVLRKLVNSVNGIPAGTIVKYNGTGGGTVTPPVDTSGNVLASYSANIAAGTLTGSSSGTHGPNVNLSIVDSTRVSGQTKALRVATTATGNQQGVAFYWDATQIFGGKTYKFTVVASRPSGAADLYKDVYTTVKWRKPKPNGATGTDLVYEYQGGAVDSGSGLVTTSTFVAIAPENAITAGLIIRHSGNASQAGNLFDVYSVKMEEVPSYVNPTKQYEVAFCRPRGNMFATDNIWTKDVSSAPLDSNSAAMVNTLLTKDLGGKKQDGSWSNSPVFNLLAFASSTYVVDANHPKINVGFQDAQHKQYTPGELYGATSGAFRDAPIPWEAVSGGGGDSHVTFIQLDANGVPKTLHDMWQFYKDRAITLQEGGVTPSKAAAGDYSFKNASQIAAAGDNWNGFSATWGGRVVDLSQNNGIFPPNTGTSATGIVAAGGTVGILEAQAGVIDHALYMSIVFPRRYDQFSYPANRSDGFIQTGDGYGINTEDALMEGQRVRLDPTLNLDSLGLSPMGKMIAKALQKYGAIVGDKTGALEFEGESPRPYLQRGLVNPWDAIIGSQNIYQNFPWDKLQVIQKDWGKPGT